MFARQFLHHWLRSTARDAVLNAAKEQMAASPADQDRDVCYDVGLVFALSIESGGLVDLLEGVCVTKGHGITVREGRLNGRQIVIVEAGAGRQLAADATHALLDAYRPRWVVSSGFAGALDASLRRGDMLLGDSLIDAEGRMWTADPALLSPWLAAGLGVRAGRLLTFDQVVRLPAEKASLGEKFAALAIDMESLAVADVCETRGVPFAAVRVVNDAVADELPPDVERLLRQTSNAARFGAALGTVFRRPSSVKELLSLQQNAITASDCLAKYLARAISQLPTCSTPGTTADSDSTPPA